MTTRTPRFGNPQKGPVNSISHRYAAILAADVAHYSTLMESDEEGTVQALKDCRSVFQCRVSEHHGREFGSVGDRLFAHYEAMAFDLAEMGRLGEAMIWSRAAVRLAP